MLDAVQMPGRHQVHIDRSRDVLLTDFGRATLSDRYLMPGEEFQDLFARVASYYGDDAGACPAHLRLHVEAVVHAVDAGPVERRHPARPADLLLPERGVRQPGRHRRAVERECLAGLEGRRHRLLLGQPALDRREGGRGRQDLRRDPVHPGDGQPDPGDLPGLAAAGFGGGLSAGLAPRDRGVRRDPPPDRRRSEPQGAEPAPRHPGVRRVHARGGGGRAVGAAVAEGRNAGAVDLGARAVGSHPDRADRDRRAVPDLLRPREPRAAGASQAGRARGEDLQPVLRDHPADRTRPARHGAHRGVLPVLAEPGELVRVAGPSDVHRGHHALPRQRAAGLHRSRAAGDGEGALFRDARAQRRASA